MNMLIWTDSDQQANIILRRLAWAAQASPFAVGKLERARAYLIDSHTRQIDELEWNGEPFVRYCDVPGKHDDRPQDAVRPPLTEVPLADLFPAGAKGID